MKIEIWNYFENCDLFHKEIEHISFKIKRIAPK